MLLPTSLHRPLFDAIGAHYALPWPTPGVLAEAIAWHESRGEATARRYEVATDRGMAPSSDADARGRDDGIVEDSTSWGLGQIMGFNVRALTGIPRSARVPMDFGWVMNPPENIALYCRLLQQIHAAAIPQSHPVRRLAVALARYNGGSVGNPAEDGSLRNRTYVLKLTVAIADVLADRLGSARTQADFALLDLLKHEIAA